MRPVVVSLPKLFITILTAKGTHIFKPQHEIMYLRTCSPSEHSDQPVQSRCLLSLRCPRDKTCPWRVNERPAKTDQMSCLINFCMTHMSGYITCISPSAQFFAMKYLFSLTAQLLSSHTLLDHVDSYFAQIIYSQKSTNVKSI